MKQFVLDKDTAIDSNDLNYMITRRYNLLNYHLEDMYEKKKKELDNYYDSARKKKLGSSSEYSLLDSLSKHSILSILHKKVRK